MSQVDLSKPQRQNPYSVNYANDVTRVRGMEDKKITSNDRRKATDLALKRDGYGIEARPYEFNEDAFQNQNNEKWQETLNNRLEGLENRSAPTVQGYQGATPMAQAVDQNTAISNQSRQQQMQLLTGLQGQFQNQAAGNQTSVGEIAANQQREAALENAMAMQASARGGNVAAASRNAGRMMGDANEQFMQQAALSRAAEAQQAQQGLLNMGNQYAQVRGQDIGVAQANQSFANQAGLANQASQLQMIQNQNQMGVANLNAQMQQNQMNDQMTQYYLNQGMTLDQAQWESNMELERQRAAQHQNAQATQAGLNSAKAGQPSKAGQIIGGALSAAGGVAALFSDKTIKTDVKKADKDVGEFLDKLQAYQYKYKNGEYGETEKPSFGIMAQDLEKSEIGKTLVNETDQGIKTVDTIKGFGAVLAATQALHKRVKQLEGGKR